MDGSTHKTLVAVGHGATLHLLGTATSSLAGLTALILVSRRAGYDDLGLFSLGLGAALGLSLLTRLGLDYSVTHYVGRAVAAGEPARAGAVTRAALAIAGLAGLAGAAALWFAAPLLSQWLQEPRLEVVLRAFAPSVPFQNLVMVASGAFRGLHRIGGYVLLRLIGFPVLTTGALAGGLFLETDVAAGALAWTAAAAATGVAAVLLVLAALPKRDPTVRAPRLLRFGAWTLSLQALHFVVLWIDIVILAVYYENEVVGYYRAAAQVAILLTIGVTAYESLYAPLANVLWLQGRHKRLADATHYAGRTTFAFTSAIALPLLLLPDLVLFPFGPNIGSAIPAFVILGLAHAIGSALGPSGSLLLMGGRPEQETYATIPAVAIAVLGSLWLVPTQGIIGAAIATAVAVLARNALRWAFLRRQFQLEPMTRRIAIGILLFLVCFTLAAMGTRQLPASSVAIAIGFSLAYAVLSIGWVMTPGDRHALIGSLRQLLTVAKRGNQEPVPPSTPP